MWRNAIDDSATLFILVFLTGLQNPTIYC